MDRVICFNGSPLMENGNTAQVLGSFIEGMAEAGVAVDLYYTGKLKLKPCVCGNMHCWYKNPGECCINDDMQSVYPKLKKADVLILATPVYMPLPGGMQNLLNRLVPLIKPLLEKRGQRTRARFHKDVNIKKIVLVSTGDWWEKENFDVVVHIVRELAENTGAIFAGAILRPHALLMWKDNKLTDDAKAVLKDVKSAGYRFVKTGLLDQKTLDLISRPLIEEAELRQKYNSMIL